MKTRVMRHKKFNCEFTQYGKEAFLNLNEQQANAIAAFVSDLSRRLAESELLQCLYQMKIDGVENIEIPDRLEFDLSNFKSEEE